MVAYAFIETVLARRHHADERVQRGAFRGRIKHLQRLGLPLGHKPGRGKRIDYSKDQVWQLAFALELSEFGIDPTVIIQIIETLWKQELADKFMQQEEILLHKSEVLVLSVGFMSAAWRPAEDHMSGLISLSWIDRLRTIEYITTINRRSVCLIDTWRLIDYLNKEIFNQKEI